LPDAIGLTLFSINTCCSNGNTGIFMITDWICFDLAQTFKTSLPL
jgi:hypothetical protein